MRRKCQSPIMKQLRSTEVYGKRVSRAVNDTKEILAGFSAEEVLEVLAYLRLSVGASMSARLKVSGGDGRQIAAKRMELIEEFILDGEKAP